MAFECEMEYCGHVYMDMFCLEAIDWIFRDIQRVLLQSCDMGFEPF